MDPTIVTALIGTAGILGSAAIAAFATLRLRAAETAKAKAEERAAEIQRLAVQAARLDAANEALINNLQEENAWLRAALYGKERPP